MNFDENTERDARVNQNYAALKGVGATDSEVAKLAVEMDNFLHGES